AGLAFEHALFFWRHPDAVIARNSHDIGDDRQWAKPGADLVKYQPDFCPACYGGGIDAAHMAGNLRAGRKINAAARFQRFERALPELHTLLCDARVQGFLQPDQHSSAGDHGIRFERQARALASIRRMSVASGWLRTFASVWRDAVHR